MNRLAGAFIVVSLLFSIAFSQNKSGNSDNYDPESIDPLQENIGDFLDVDIMQYKNRAYELYNEQKYLDAAKYYLKTLSYDINDIISLYNLACCYGLMGEEELAALFLKRSVRAGFDDIEHIKRDSDFDEVRGKEIFDAAVDSIAFEIEQKQMELGNTIFETAPILLKCRMHLPADYNPQKTYTLIVGLHGYGSNPDGFITLWKRFGEDKYIYASPQAPYAFPVGTNVGYSWAMGNHTEAISSTAMNLSEDYICHVVTNICMNYNVEKVFLLGFSQGCGFTYSTGIKNHYLFDGLICFGGWLDTDWISEQSLRGSRNLRVFISHGKNDNMVKFEEGENAYKILKENGYDVTFEAFDGGHTVPEEIMKKAIVWIGEEAE